MKKALCFILTFAILITCTAAITFAEEQNATVSIGDANLDQKINLIDVAKILQHIAGWEQTEEISTVNADLNADGKVTLMDAAMLLRHIAEWDKVIIPTSEYYEWLDVCDLLRKDGQPVPTFDEWLAEQGIDVEKYHEWWDVRQSLNMISYEEWLAEQGN